MSVTLAFASALVDCAGSRSGPRALPADDASADGALDAAARSGRDGRGGRDAAAAALAAHRGGASPVAERELDPRVGEIDALVDEAIAAGKAPGCVIVVGRHDDVLFRRAYGARAVLPERVPMTVDTVFDLASLTKPVATAMSVMVLVERGRIDLGAPAARYVPELSRLPPMTVEQLLLHTSGLPAVTAAADHALEPAARMQRFGALTLKSRPGERFVYSDVGFSVLEEIVRRQGGKDLATFAREEVWAPLGMTETSFLPPPDLRARAAPTEARDGGFVPGDVHDPRAFLAGGVAGHAGVFSTADDLTRFAQAMLGRGTLEGRRVLSEKTFDVMVARRETSSGGRALGWDRDSKFATHKGARLSARAFGHGGYTGTVLWVDPAKDVFFLFLSNRVHPDGKGAVNPLVAELSSRGVGLAEVDTGVDVLRGESFARLAGMRVGLVTNASAKAKDGTPTADVFAGAPGVTLSAIFTPEHGMTAAREGKIEDATYAGVRVYSLYGERTAPPADVLARLDAIVVDLQDVGVRFYTYASTMKRVLRAAAERGLRVFVLDRPNPLGGLAVEGPLLPAARAGSFVNHHPLPVRHGMTMGELARLFVDGGLDAGADGGLEAKLDVVRMRGWRRKDYFDRTGLTWTAPSPNLRSVEEVVLYPMVGLLEATNLSVGRGTDTPFEIVGAPFVDGEALARRFATETWATEGLTAEPTSFTPTASVHRGKKCGGLRLWVTDRGRFSPVRAALALAASLRDLYPSDWQLDGVDRLLVDADAMAALRAGRDPRTIEAAWAAGLRAFHEQRERALLY